MEKKSFKGESLIILAGLFYSVESILVKTLSREFSGIQISFYRFIFGLIFSLLALFILRKELRFREPWTLTGRAVAGVLSMIAYYLAVQWGNPARALLLNLTYPVFAMVYGFLFFKEKAGWKEMVSMLLCLGGILLVFYDGSPVPWQANFWALVSGGSAGMAVHFIRRASQVNNSYIIYIVVCVLGIPVSLSGFSTWKAVQTPDVLFLLLIAFVVFIGQILMQTGFRFITAVRGSILGYASIPFTMLLSHFLIGENITLLMVVGALLIFAAVTFNTLTRSIQPAPPDTGPGH